MEALLDSSPMIVHRPEEGWCCLLCLRKFTSEAHVQKHLAKSSFHAENLTAAVAEGRVGGVHKPPQPSAASKRPREEEREALPLASGGSGGGSSLSNKLSAIEQMELFEKRLKVEKQRQPEKPSASHEAEVDSNRARSINQQRDWECSGCAMVSVLHGRLLAPPLSGLLSVHHLLLQCHLVFLPPPAHTALSLSLSHTHLLTHSLCLFLFASSCFLALRRRSISPASSCAANAVGTWTRRPGT
jgi:hypothetical protein